jgi:Alcohol dehydrogenase GroES-like domain
VARLCKKVSVVAFTCARGGPEPYLGFGTSGVFCWPCFIPCGGAVFLYMSKETPMLNPIAVLYGPHDVRIEDRPVPKPAPGQVLVEIAAIGICGSDVHYYEHGRIGD